MWSRAGAAIMALGLLGAVLSACGGGGTTGNGLLTRPEKSPALHGAGLGGGQIDTAALRGHVVVLNFYASWCDPCRRETPLLVRTAAATKAVGVDFVGVLYKDSATNGAAFRRSDGVTYPSLIDADGTSLAMFRHVNPNAIPDTLVLDKSGRVAARYIGPITDESAFAQVLTSLAQRSD